MSDTAVQVIVIIVVAVIALAIVVWLLYLAAALVLAFTAFVMELPTIITIVMFILFPPTLIVFLVGLAFIRFGVADALAPSDSEQSNVSQRGVAGTGVAGTRYLNDAELSIMSPDRMSPDRLGVMTYITCEADLDAYMQGRWYKDDRGFLYIVPKGELEPLGPDNDAMDFLVSTDPEDDGFVDQLRKFALELVPGPSRRWSPEDGFYHV